MKKNIIALAIASVFAAPVAMAGAPTIYGQVSMAVDSYDMKDAAGNTVDLNSGTQINSRTSKFGIKGSEDLGEGLTAVYKFEFGVNIDNTADTTGTVGALNSRNQYVGVAGGFGTVLLGRHDTPFKMSQGTDLFNYSPVADINKMADGLGTLKKGGENRLSNVLAYVSPAFSGVTLVAAFVPKEKSGDTATASSLTDITSFAVMYGSKKEGLYLSGAMDSISSEFIGGVNSSDHLRLVAQYSTGGLVANVMYQDFGGKALETTNQEGTTIGGGVAYKVGKFTPKLQVMQLDRTKTFEDSVNYAVGLDYSLGKKTTVFAEYATLENVGGAANTKAETTALSIGLTHKF